MHRARISVGIVIHTNRTRWPPVSEGFWAEPKRDENLSSGELPTVPLPHRVQPNEKALRSSVACPSPKRSNGKSEGTATPRHIPGIFPTKPHRLECAGEHQHLLFLSCSHAGEEYEQAASRTRGQGEIAGNAMPESERERARDLPRGWGLCGAQKPTFGHHHVGSAAGRSRSKTPEVESHERLPVGRRTGPLL